MVALRKESVDRNTNPGSTSLTFPGSLSARRAWIEIRCSCCPGWLLASLSARRAWIEILPLDDVTHGGPVALRKESVDRNIDTQNLCVCVIQSLSARRAWIEMLLLCSSILR